MDKIVKLIADQEKMFPMEDRLGNLVEKTLTQHSPDDDQLDESELSFVYAARGQQEFFE